MRIKFRHIKVTYDQFTVVHIINLDSQLLGLAVSEVSDVLALNDAQFLPVAPSAGVHAIDYLSMLAKTKTRSLPLIDIKKLLTLLNIHQLNKYGA